MVLVGGRMRKLAVQCHSYLQSSVGHIPTTENLAVRKRWNMALCFLVPACSLVNKVQENSRGTISWWNSVFSSHICPTHTFLLRPLIQENTVGHLSTRTGIVITRTCVYSGWQPFVFGLTLVQTTIHKSAFACLVASTILDLNEHINNRCLKTKTIFPQNIL